jgi:putative two-component system response regulator
MAIERIEKNAPESAFLAHAKVFAGTHHEKWDGSGYPENLKGDAIPLEGRLMAIADVYDALISERPYKKPFSHTQAVEIIISGRGSHFEPGLVDVFLQIAPEFDKTAQQYGNK